MAWYSPITNLVSNIVSAVTAKPTTTTLTPTQQQMASGFGAPATTTTTPKTTTPTGTFQSALQKVTTPTTQTTAQNPNLTPTQNQLAQSFVTTNPLANIPKVTPTAPAPLTPAQQQLASSFIPKNLSQLPNSNVGQVTGALSTIEKFGSTIPVFDVGNRILETLGEAGKVTLTNMGKGASAIPKIAFAESTFIPQFAAWVPRQFFPREGTWANRFRSLELGQKELRDKTFDSILKTFSVSNMGDMANQARDEVLGNAGSVPKETVNPEDINPKDDFKTVTVGGVTYKVPDNMSPTDYANQLQNDLNNRLAGNTNKRISDEQNLIQQQNDNAIKELAKWYNMSEADVRAMVQSDPNARILYDEAWKKIKDAQEEAKSKMDKKNEDNLSSDTDSVTDSDPEEYLKNLKKEAKLSEFYDAIKSLKDDQAEVASFYQQRRDEIANNPEYPQWLKARRDTFISSKENVALKLYETKLKNLIEAKDEAEKLVVQYYNAYIDSQRLAMEEKKYALDVAENARQADKDRLATIVQQLADQGTNWASIPAAQRNAILAGFTDPAVANNMLSVFDFKKAYDNKLALDWAGKTKSTSYKAPTTAQNRQLFIEWLTSDGSGKYTVEQLKSIAQNAGVTVAEGDALSALIDENKSSYIQKNYGMLGWDWAAKDKEAQVPDAIDPVVSFANFKSEKGFGNELSTGGGGGGTATPWTIDDVKHSINLHKGEIGSVYKNREALAESLIANGAPAAETWRWIYELIPSK